LRLFDGVAVVGDEGEMMMKDSDNKI